MQEKEKKKNSSTLAQDDAPVVGDALWAGLTVIEPRSCEMGFYISDTGHGFVPTGTSTS